MTDQKNMYSETSLPTNGSETNEASRVKNAITYADAGVNIETGNELVREIGPIAKSTARIGSDSNLGGFGGLFDLKACGYKDPILVAGNDGVGTKVKIAIETGRHSEIGIDLVAMCVNDLIVQGAEPLFFLDYYATAKLELDKAKQVISGIAEGCKQAGCALIGGETAEMPGLYASGDYDLAGFSVGAVERDAVLPSPNIGAGHKLIGLASSGIHSNGYSLVRRLVEMSGLKWEDAVPFQDAQGDETLMADAFLRPTRIYVKQILAALRAGLPVHGLAHITGGGLTENLPRILPETCSAQIDLDSWQLPSIFQWLASVGNISEPEMLKTFNCGIGMVLVVPAEASSQVMTFFTEQGETVFDIGELISKSGSDAVIYQGKLAL
jgi:phosphoribosylformylglycinamidine cyclo-ligase